MRRWGRRGRSWLPLVVLSCGLGLYWAATQAAWLAVGWRPALATTLLYLYLAAVSAVVGLLTRMIDGMEALAQRGLGRERPSR